MTSHNYHPITNHDGMQHDQYADTERRYELGNDTLPIARQRDEIVDAFTDSQTTVITAETGAGKSTQVPQYLAEAGYGVIVTQPRVVAARTLANRVREEVIEKKGKKYADFVGHRTASEHGDSANNRITYVTDGLQAVRELVGSGIEQKQVLVLDEVHEWNLNMEVLVAWAKKRSAEDPNFKSVLMSATMEAKQLAQFMAHGDETVPVIEVAGRTYEVAMEESDNLIESTKSAVRAGENTLVFVPGKGEIESVIRALDAAKIPGVTVLPLHGQLDKEEQQKVFKKYPGTKVIVATNIAQTSLTIDDIDTVVDSGTERRSEVKNNVDGLYLRPISRADCLQRAGRAGRTKAGRYVLAPLGSMPQVPIADRPEYSTPEILRTRLDGTVLRLEKNGFAADDLEFYNVVRRGPEVSAQFAADVSAAKKRLTKLGAFDEKGDVTSIGRDMDKLSVESHYARMMIEARKYSPDVQLQMAGLLAVQEAGGIRQFGTRNRPCEERWREFLTPNCNDSDMIKELEVYIAAQSMSNTERRGADIYGKSYHRANEVFRQLRKAERLEDMDFTWPSKEQREQLVKCIIAGSTDTLYVDAGYGHKSADGTRREIGNRSGLRVGRMVVGTPFDLDIQTTGGSKTLHLIEGVTNIPSVDLLREVAPQLFTERSSGLSFSADGVVVEVFEQLFDGNSIGESTSRLAPESTERRDCIVKDLLDYSEKVNRPYNLLINQVKQLEAKMGHPIAHMSRDDLGVMLTTSIPLEVASLGEATNYLPRIALDEVISEQAVAQIHTENPDDWMGVSLTYSAGVPLITENIEAQTVLDLADAGGQLPNGKEIYSAGPTPVSVTQYASRIREVRQQAVDAAEKIQRYQEAKESGLPSDVRLSNRHDKYRVYSDSWVIQADGSVRDSDAKTDSYYDAGGNYDSGGRRWEQILPGEIVLTWSKADRHSRDEFETVVLPREGVTLEQQAAAQALIRAIYELWPNRNADGEDWDTFSKNAGWKISPEDLEKIEKNRQLASRADGVWRRIDAIEADEISDELRKQMRIVENKAFTLWNSQHDPAPGYASEVMTLERMADKLVKRIESYRAPSNLGHASSESLEALAARFGR